MEYFGGAGSGKGWYKFKFIIHPEEFKALFSDSRIFFVITNTRVDSEYEFSDKEDINRAYVNYYRKVISAERWDRKKDWKISSDIRVSVIDSINKVNFSSIEERKGSDRGRYKSVTVSEPVINISPFSLTLGENSKLGIESFNEEGNIGIELNYPRVISLSSENHELIHETSSYEVKKLYDDLVSRIKSICKKLVNGIPWKFLGFKSPREILTGVEDELPSFLKE